MLIRDPYFQLYLLHVAALFVIALWPRISHPQARQEQPQPLECSAARPPVELAAPPGPGMVRNWSLGLRSRGLPRFQELESAWSAECASKFSHVLERISLI
jgi:hypothetical protein